MNAEQLRLDEDSKRILYWKRWGPYLSERQWGTVREDYSPYGTAWDYFPHDQARSRAYRWGEDGLLGICDSKARLCFAPAFWNGKDPILKERMFGLTGSEGNHGEDVKELYYYLESTPTHSYCKALYKYPQQEFPYARLVDENRRRGREMPEFELLDTGVFNEDRYFDIFVEYAKSAPEDVLIKITAINRGPDPAELHMVPSFWYRNYWSWDPNSTRPNITIEKHAEYPSMMRGNHPVLGNRWFVAEGTPEFLFTENETDYRKVFGSPNKGSFVKDAFHEYIVNGNADAINGGHFGTKAGYHYKKTVQPGEAWVVRLQMLTHAPEGETFNWSFENTFDSRIRECEEYYDSISAPALTEDQKMVQRQAWAGMLWSKQYFGMIVDQWLNGDPAGPPPPGSRKNGRNHEWTHLFVNDVLSMPDKWEYPWFAAWDLAFHCIPLAMIDPELAKNQLLLLTHNWYMHPNGQLPAYEWAFDDVNPPVHAWAALRVFNIERRLWGRSDRLFLQRVFNKLLMNFTWWVNRKDAEGRNLFQGGFLGLDNIGVFDRSRPLPTGGFLEQSDGTSWMAMYCLNMLAIAIELARDDASYEDIATKFFEHFLEIANAMNNMGQDKHPLWHEEDGFFYDNLNLPNVAGSIPLRVRSMVGIIPLFAVEVMSGTALKGFSSFRKHTDWFLGHRKNLAKNVSFNGRDGVEGRRIMSIVEPEQLRRILGRILDENEFLSPYGVRAVSRYHLEHPYVFRNGEAEYAVDYEPAESKTGTFGGNSNWRGPIWMPVNYLLIESLQKFHYYFGDEFKVECPTGSGRMLSLWEVSIELSHRLLSIFEKDENGKRAVFGGNKKMQEDPHFRDYLLFHEYFHGDNGSGLGANHQTGWTGLVAKLQQQRGEYCPHLTIGTFDPRAGKSPFSSAATQAET